MLHITNEIRSKGLSRSLNISFIVGRSAQPARLGLLKSCAANLRTTTHSKRARLKKYDTQRGSCASARPSEALVAGRISATRESGQLRPVATLPHVFKSASTWSIAGSQTRRKPALLCGIWNTAFVCDSILRCTGLRRASFSDIPDFGSGRVRINVQSTRVRGHHAVRIKNDQNCHYTCTRA